MRNHFHLVVETPNADLVEGILGSQEFKREMLQRMEGPYERKLANKS